MSKVIILNGPPGCGKDTIGAAFCRGERNSTIRSFKEPMFRIAATTMGMDWDDFRICYEDREWKDSPKESLNGHTVRELLQNISETYIKPFFGSAYFGVEALRGVNNASGWANTIVFTDGGFADEINTLATAAGHEVVLVHVYRDGCTFEGDTRNYVLSNEVRAIYTLRNNGTVEEAVDELGRILDAYEQTFGSVDQPAEDEPRNTAPAPRLRSGRATATRERTSGNRPARVHFDSSGWSTGVFGHTFSTATEVLEAASAVDAAVARMSDSADEASTDF